MSEGILQDSRSWSILPRHWPGADNLQSTSDSLAWAYDVCDIRGHLASKEGNLLPSINSQTIQLKLMTSCVVMLLGMADN